MPFDPATVPPLARQRLKLLETALTGIHLSDAERATLAHLAAGQDVETIRNLAAVMARARQARPRSLDELAARLVVAEGMVAGYREARGGADARP
ncbi:MAG TPA: hypothetical protein VHY21_08175 [Pseudonocardiaceae bacterium]|jgi:hypothetical protein|nr:hypothetical protein [Pseudonocardiaceae bacterium]